MGVKMKTKIVYGKDKEFAYLPDLTFDKYGFAEIRIGNIHILLYQQSYGVLIEVNEIIKNGHINLVTAGLKM